MNEYTIELSFTYVLNADDEDEAVERAMTLFDTLPDTPGIYVDGKLWN